MPYATPQNVFLSAAFMLLISFGFVAVGIAIASLLTDAEAFQLIINFVVFPLFLFSNALFPTDRLHQWLAQATLLNPLSWGVSALRGMLVNNDYSVLPAAFAILIAFDAVAIITAGRLFDKTSI